MSSCPGEAALGLLGTDALGDGSYAAIEQHVEGCPECKADLERLAHQRRDPTVVFSGPERLPRIPGFEIQSELGRGGMGVVYLAIETGLDRLVALKILPCDLGPGASTGPRRRWLREARAVSSVRHPNIVPLYDYGEADGWFFLVLEYVPGGTLKHRLAEPLPPRVAAELVETIARAVGHVHSRGLFHLDLKPSNILLDCEENSPWDQATPRISDFGLALSNDNAGASEKSLAGIWGTPSYMAPEQTIASRADVGASADIYALGAILYDLLTGRAPFWGTSTLETLDQVRGQNPVPPRRLNAKIPRDLETIALKCLEKNPSRRYASADALAGDMRRWLDGRPIQARPVSPFGRAWRWCRRQPVIAVLTVTLIVTLIGGFLVLWAMLRRSETLRSGSEANYEVASRSLDELLNVFEEDRSIGKVDSNHGYERLKALESTRSYAIEFWKRYPIDFRGLRRLAMIDRCLALVRHGGGKEDEARSLLEESITYFEACLALALDDVEIQRELLLRAEWILALLTDSGNDHLYERWNARAFAMLQRSTLSDEDDLRGMFRLSRAHRYHASSLIARGESERARKELEEDLDLVRSVPAAKAALPGFVLSEALTLAALGQWSGEFRLARSPIRSHPGNVEFEYLEMGLAELTARRIGWLPTIVKSPWLLQEHLTTEAWTDRVISAIQSDAARFELDRARVPAIAWLMREHIAWTLSRYRAVGILDDAQRLVNQLVALAKRLSQSYPDQAAPYMLLSEGYVQRAKNAWRVPGKPVIEWERKAVDAAKHAATLDPENEVPRILVKILRARVNKLASK